MRFLRAAVLVLMPAVASAQIYGLLKDTPSQYFDDTDLQLFRAATTDALEHGAVNQAIAWENPKTRHGGNVTVLREFQSKQRPCKQLRVRNQAKGLKSDNRFDVCTVDGQWKFVPKSEL
jgi:surface antigen